MHSLSKESANGKIPKRSRGTWKWRAHTAKGKIHESFTKDVQRTIKGEKIKRRASADEPAYLIEQEDGDLVLKSRAVNILALTA